MDANTLSHQGQPVQVMPPVPPDVQAINALMVPLSQVMSQIEQTRAESEKVKVHADLEKARMEHATQGRLIVGVMVIMGGFAAAGIVAFFMPQLNSGGEKLIYGVISFFAGWGLGRMQTKSA